MIEIPHDRLSEEALRGLLEEYATRGGYDSEQPLESRIAELRQGLRSGRLRIVFDPVEETTNVVGSK